MLFFIQWMIIVRPWTNTDIIKKIFSFASDCMDSCSDCMDSCIPVQTIMFMWRTSLKLGDRYTMMFFLTKSEFASWERQLKNKIRNKTVSLSSILKTAFDNNGLICQEKKSFVMSRYFFQLKERCILLLHTIYSSNNIYISYNNEASRKWWSENINGNRYTTRGSTYFQNWIFNIFFWRVSPHFTIDTT